jgi:hypothetical protein
MYFCQQRRHLFYGGQILETLFGHYLTIYFIGGLRCRPIQKEHSLYTAEEPEKVVYNVRCL